MINISQDIEKSQQVCIIVSPVSVAQLVRA